MGYIPGTNGPDVRSQDPSGYRSGTRQPSLLRTPSQRSSHNYSSTNSDEAKNRREYHRAFIGPCFTGGRYERNQKHQGHAGGGPPLLPPNPRLLAESRARP